MGNSFFKLDKEKIWVSISFILFSLYLFLLLNVSFTKYTHEPISPIIFLILILPLFLSSLLTSSFQLLFFILFLILSLFWMYLLSCFLIFLIRKYSHMKFYILIIILLVIIVFLPLLFGFIWPYEKADIQNFHISPPAPANSGNPLTMSPSSGQGDFAIASTGEELVLKFNVYCNKEEGCPNVNIKNIFCTSNIIKDLNMNSPRNINFNNSAELSAIFHIKEDSELGTYLCSASFTNIDNIKDFILKIED